MPTKKEKNKRSIVLGDENQENLGSTPAKAWFLGIGIDDYEEFPKLNNAVKDVEDVMKVLIQKYDLEEENAFLLLNENATEDNIIDKLDYFSKNLSNADKLMIYYSGHGHLDRTTGLGFWIPQDAIQGKTARYIRNSTIRDYINVIKTRHTLLISDSCFSGSLFVRGASRATSSAIEELESLESRWGICSGRADEEVNDGPPGGNSPFAQSIIDSLKRNQQKFLNVAKLADKVILQTRSNYEQLPEGNPMYGVGHKGGQYIFRLKANEKEAWAACQTEGTLAAYQLFVQNYPDGKNAVEAKAELNFLKEEEAWATAQTKNTISAYTHYDQQFPNGRYARQSLMAIADLEDEQSWAEACRRNNITAYKEYLLEHPDGDYVAQANTNLQELLNGRKTKKSTNKIAVDSSAVELEAKKVETDPEQAAWNKAKNLDTEEAYNQFYLRFPHGKFRNEVRAALNRFKEGAAIIKVEPPVQAKPVQEKTVNSGGLSKEKKIGIGVGAVLLPLLIWGMIALFSGDKTPVNSSMLLTATEIEAKLVDEGFEVRDLQVNLNGGQLSILGAVETRGEKRDIKNYLLTISQVNSVDDQGLTVNHKEEEAFNGQDDETGDSGTDANEDQGESDEESDGKVNPSPSPASKVKPLQMSVEEKDDRLLVRITEGKEPYKMEFLKGSDVRYSKDIDIAGVYTILLADYQNTPGNYLVRVKDSEGNKMEESYAIEMALKVKEVNSLYGHTYGIGKVIFSPDGKNILSCSGDGNAKLWNANGDELRNFPNSGTAIDFSSDGKNILTGSFDRIARLWDLKGNQIQTFPGHRYTVLEVAFSPDEKNVLTSSDKTAILWDMKGNKLMTFEGHRNYVNAAVFAPNGKTILTASGDDFAKLWNLKGEEIKTFVGHSDAIFDAVFSPNGKYILTGSVDKTAKLWNLKGKTVHTFSGHEGYVHAVAFSPDGKYILTGSQDKTAILWDLDGNQLAVLRGHTDIVWAVTFSPDGKTILTGSKDKTIKIWKLE